MVEPEWIDEVTVLALHREQLNEFGGLAGVRDHGLLLSALARAQHIWSYTTPKPDAIRLAAAYAHGIAKNHPFLDGNKRTALIVCHLFLRRNGFAIDAPQVEQVRVILDLAASAIDEDQLEFWIRSVAKPAD